MYEVSARCHQEQNRHNARRYISTVNKRFVGSIASPVSIASAWCHHPVRPSPVQSGFKLCDQKALAPRSSSGPAELAHLRGTSTYSWQFPRRAWLLTNTSAAAMALQFAT